MICMLLALPGYWNTTYREWLSTFVPTLISFSRSVGNDPCFTVRGRTRRRRNTKGDGKKRRPRSYRAGPSVSCEEKVFFVGR